MADTKLLPYEVIDAKLLDAVAVQQDKDDKGSVGKPPEYWMLVSREAKKTEVFNQVFEQAFEQVESLGVDRALPGICLKCLLMGWNMANIYLQQQIEKSAGA